MFGNILKFRPHSCLIRLPKLFATKPAAKIDDTSLEQVHIDEAIKFEPLLKSVPIDLWTKSHGVFINHGLKTTNFLRIVTGNPQVIVRQPKKIIQTLEDWRSCQFGEKLMHILITKYPEFLDVPDGRKLVKHVTFLRQFVTTNKNVWKLLMNSPDLITQPEATIKEKIDYITNVMRIEVPELVKSAALSRPLFDIQCRHVLLDRLGVFKPRPPKANPDEPTKNARLYRITDTSDKTFATKVARVSMEEFEAFQMIYKMELDEENEDEDSDYESDDDDELNKEINK